MKKRVAQLLTVALLFSASARAQTPPDNAQVERLVDSLGQSFVTTHGAPAVSIAVIRGKDTLAFGARGLSGIETTWRPHRTACFALDRLPNNSRRPL